MAETDQAPSAAPDAGGQATADVSGVESYAPTANEVVWIVGQVSTPTDALPADDAGMYLPGDTDQISAATVSEIPANLDHALDQLTTGTDLFHLPVLDFHSS